MAAYVITSTVPRVSMGVMTNYVDWVLICYDAAGDDNQPLGVLTYEVTLQLSSHVHTKASLTELVGLLRQTLL